MYQIDNETYSWADILTPVLVTNALQVKQTHMEIGIYICYWEWVIDQQSWNLSIQGP